MVQEQWLQLKMKSLWGSNMKIVTRTGGDEPLIRENKNLVEEGYSRIFSSRGMNKILAHVGIPILS